jgi:hypothetical protein
MVEVLNELGQLFKPHLYQVALAIVATVLVIFGNTINRMIKKLLHKQHIIVRIVAFILVCAFGYGLATVWLTAILASQLAKIPLLYLAPLISGLFILLGLYAQKQRHI